MPTRTYNQFFQWIKKDNFLTVWPNFIEGKNVTGLKDGYGITLWPKPVKLLFTTNSIRSSFFRFNAWTWFDENYALSWLINSTWEIYDLNNPVDFTPDKVITLADTIYPSLVEWVFFRGEYYLVWEREVSWSSQYAIHRTSSWNPITGTYVFDVTTWSLNSWTPPILKTNDFLYFWFTTRIDRFDSSAVKTAFSIFWSGSIVWMSQHWTNILVYTDEGFVYYWDGVSASITAKNELWFIPKKVAQSWSIDYITWEDGEMYLWGWYAIQRIIERTRSNRLEDNSQYITKFNFDTSSSYVRTLQPVKWGLLAVADDTLPGIYQYDNITEWLPKWFHKILCTNSQWLQINKFNDISYIPQTNKLYISYEDGVNNGVDIVDFESKETAKDWYLVSDVFSWWTAFEKEIEVIRFAQSYNGWINNWISLFKRINNWIWEEIILTKPLSDTITRENLTLITEEWIDFQFKIVFNNELQDDTPPMFHELSHDYSITKS